MKIWKVYEDYTNSMYIVKAKTETEATKMVTDTIYDKWKKYSHEDDSIEDEVYFDATEVLCDSNIDMICMLR